MKTLFRNCFFFLLTLSGLTFPPLHAQVQSVPDQLAAWQSPPITAEWKQVEHDGSFPFKPGTPDLTFEYSAKTLEENPILKEILQQHPPRQERSILWPALKSLLDYWHSEDLVENSDTNPTAGSDITKPLPDSLTKSHVIQKEIQQSEQINSTFKSNESEGSFDTPTCNISLTPGDSLPAGEGETESNIDWLVTMAKYAGENIGHQLTECLANSGVNQETAGSVIDQVLASLSTAKNQLEPESFDPNSFSTPDSIQNSATHTAYDSSSSPGAITIVEFPGTEEEKSKPQTLPSGRYLMKRSSHTDLVLMLGFKGRTILSEECLASLLKPNINLSESKVDLEVDVLLDTNNFQQILSSQKDDYLAGLSSDNDGTDSAGKKRSFTLIQPVESR